jgi:hypothetical protein
MFIFWVVEPCGLVGSPEDGDRMFLRDLGIHLISPFGVTSQKNKMNNLTNKLASCSVVPDECNFNRVSNG